MADDSIWRQGVEEWRASGLTARRFCEERGLNRRTLSRWSARLRPEAASPSSVRLVLARAPPGFVLSPGVSPPRSAPPPPSACLWAGSARARRRRVARTPPVHALVHSEPVVGARVVEVRSSVPRIQGGSDRASVDRGGSSRTRRRGSRSRRASVAGVVLSPGVSAPWFDYQTVPRRKKLRTSRKPSRAT